MFCRNCANPLDDRAVACPKCGVNPRDGTAFCQVCGKPTLPNAVLCVSCGATLARLAPEPGPGPGPVSDPRAHNKIAAGICGILLGALGVHKFILGYTTSGIIMLLATLVAGWLTCFISSYAMALIGLIEGIIYLTKSDEEFVKIYVVGRREWF